MGPIFGIGYSDPVLVGTICIALLFGLALLGVRVAFAAAIAGFVGMVELIGFLPGASQVGSIPYAKTSLYALSVLPPFILIGFLAFHAGMTTKLFDAARKWIGWLPGGLAVATVFAQAGFVFYAQNGGHVFDPAISVRRPVLHSCPPAPAARGPRWAGEWRRCSLRLSCSQSGTCRRADRPASSPG